MGGGWSRVQQVATSSGDKSPILFSHWVHHEHLMVKNNEYHFVSGGLKGIFLIMSVRMMIVCMYVCMYVLSSSSST